MGMFSVILVNEGFKTSSENINGNSCPEISQKIWRHFPPLNKTVVEKLQTLQCSHSGKYSADAASVQNEEYVAFFGSPLPVSEEFTQTFWKNALRWRGLQRKCASWRMTHASPVRELNLPCCSMLPTSKHRQHCCAGFLQKHSSVLWEETNCSHCQSKLKQSASAERINMHCLYTMSTLSTPSLSTEGSARPPY